MLVRNIVYLFTSEEFDLIVYDLATEEELYNGPASGVYDDPAAMEEVVSIDPPIQALKLKLNVDTSTSASHYFEIVDTVDAF